jgi:hypothetical protein
VPAHGCSDDAADNGSADHSDVWAGCSASSANFVG